MNTTIKNLEAIEILDSRGNPTISVRCQLEGGAIGEASVPSGASTGEFEAVELRDGESNRYRGKGVRRAVRNVEGEILSALRGNDGADQSRIDSTLCSLDGTPNKERLGANALLGVSLAVKRAVAESQGRELFAAIGGEQACVLPVPLVNVINGGAHAANGLDIQEFMVVPHGFNCFEDSVRSAAEVFHALGELLRNDGYDTGVGDEGGYAPRFETLDLAFEFLMKAIEKAGYKPGEQISLALDVAASELVREGDAGVRYQFSRVRPEPMTADEVISLYQRWMGQYPLVSIEDGLGENDWAGWRLITERLGSSVQLVGDDLFVTNTERLERGIKEGIANSILIKLNQIGTLSETLSAIAMAGEAKYTSVISHRSGETADATIADLAVATNAGQIKTGSMCRGERVSKYNRLLWISRALGNRAQFARPF